MDFKVIILFIVSLITAYLSFFIVRGKKSYSNKVFALFILFVGFWALGISFFMLTDTLYLAELYSKFYYVAAGGIPLFFLLFALSFPKERLVSTRVQVIAFVPYIALSCLIFYVPHFILSKIYLLEPKNAIINYPGYIGYVAYFIIIISIAYVILFKSYLKYKAEPETKAQLKIMIIGTIIPFLCGMTSNLILPVFTYQFVWVGPIFGLIVVFVVIYSIYKHHLFDTKVITAEIFTFSLWLFILLRALIAVDLTEKLINVGLFALTVFFGVFLIRSVKKEVDTREKIQKLANDLESANVHLQELDQQKSEFVSLASHQLRGPLTAIKGYASMLLDGDFGELLGETRDAVTKVFESTTNLVVLVNDYLDVSRIEQGRMQYDFSTFDLKELATTVVTELRPNIEHAKLAIDFDYDASGTFMINADQGKIKQVIGNLIDNAIKYTPRGSIHLWLTRNTPEKVLLTISDTGVGIHPDVLPHLFEKFTRAPDASKTNIMGTGLGLYVAKKMVEAHHGRVWAESAGPGKGSTFFIELDALPLPTSAGVNMEWGVPVVGK